MKVVIYSSGSVPGEFFFLLSRFGLLIYSSLIFIISFFFFFSFMGFVSSFPQQQQQYGRVALC